MCYCLLSPRGDVTSEMTSAAFVRRGNRQKRNGWRPLSLLPKFHFCCLCGEPTVNLELGPTYFSDLKDVKSWLNYNIFSNYENGKLLVQGLASWYSWTRNNGMLTKILRGLPAKWRRQFLRQLLHSPPIDLRALWISVCSMTEKETPPNSPGWNLAVHRQPYGSHSHCDSMGCSL